MKGDYLNYKGVDVIKPDFGEYFPIVQMSSDERCVLTISRRTRFVSKIRNRVQVWMRWSKKDRFKLYMDLPMKKMQNAVAFCRELDSTF